MYDPVLGIGGMLHSMLPLSKIDEEKARQQPAMFVDTGLTAMLTDFFQQGSARNRLVVKIAGCSQLLDEKGVFRIGERNNAVTRKILWKNNILIAGEDVGGTLSRTVTLNLATGVTTIRSSGKEYQI
ncbi:MAG: chemotaxis protein CheD [bacterium]|nr:chemotaxis protein CheD [bacterium]